MVTPKKEIMENLRNRRAAEGLKRLEIWAPKQLHDRIKRYAERISSEDKNTGCKD
jgi:hypothetical protein